MVDIAWLFGSAALFALGIIFLFNLERDKAELLKLAGISLLFYVLFELISPSDMSRIDSLLCYRNITLEGMLLFAGLGLCVGFIKAKFDRKKEVKILGSLLLLAIAGLLLFIFTDYTTPILYPMSMFTLWIFFRNGQKAKTVLIALCGFGIALLIEWIVYGSLLAQPMALGTFFIIIIFLSLFWTKK